MAEVTCAVCGEDIEQGVGTSCPECSVPYHDDCWEYNNSGCGIYGCRKNQVVKYSRVRKIFAGLFNRINQDSILWAPYYGAFYSPEAQIEVAKKWGGKENNPIIFLTSLVLVDIPICTHFAYLTVLKFPPPVHDFWAILFLFSMFYSIFYMLLKLAFGKKWPDSNVVVAAPSFFPLIYSLDAMKWVANLPFHAWNLLVDYSGRAKNGWNNILCELEKEGDQALKERDQLLLEEYREE